MATFRGKIKEDVNKRRRDVDKGKKEVNKGKDVGEGEEEEEEVVVPLSEISNGEIFDSSLCNNEWKTMNVYLIN